MRLRESSPVTFFSDPRFCLRRRADQGRRDSGLGMPQHQPSLRDNVALPSTQHFFARAPPSPPLRRCAGEKMRHQSCSPAILPKSPRHPATPGGFPRRRHHLDDLLSVPAQQGAGHSLLLAPKGDQRKRWRRPTHLFFGSPGEHLGTLRRPPPGGRTGPGSALREDVFSSSTRFPPSRLPRLSPPP